MENLSSTQPSSQTWHTPGSNPSQQHTRFSVYQESFDLPQPRSWVRRSLGPLC